MSTRSRTRAAEAAASAKSTKQQPKSQPTKRKSRSTVVEQSETADTEKENTKAKRIVKPKSGKTRKGKTKVKEEYCVCKGTDDGTPMVNCSECKDWFHFRCIGLSERDADDINVYVCSSCTEKTGLHTVMEWEGPDALEEVGPEENPPDIPNMVPEDSVVSPSEPDAASAAESLDSEDEYVVKDKGAGRKRRIRRLSLSSESSSIDEDEGTGKGKVKRSRTGRSTIKSPTSPGPNSQLKRKSNMNAQHAPPAKRKKETSESSAADDPTRKYCLGKLQELFDHIFLKYPHVQGNAKNVQELSDEEKTVLKDDAKKFAEELEQYVFEIYSEPESGKSGAGGKYKERFRMLQFNLSKPDRVAIHKRIASADITAKEVSLMSSTDLANEETKQSIKAAEKEALEHSILQKTKVPTAKITHKGLQDIEDVSGEVGSLRGREEEEEDKRERERMVRLKTTQPQRRTSTGQSSVPPDSPVVPQSSSWGAPPPVPMHTDEPAGASPIEPPFERSVSGFPEPELNLADLINIDEEASPLEPSASAEPSTPSVSAGELPRPSSPAVSSVPTLAPLATTGISPFATATSKPEQTPRSASFDLNSLWTAPKVSPTIASTSNPAPLPQVEPKDGLMDPDILGQDADDHDFDMFLDEKDQDGKDTAINQNPEALQAAFDALPQVWSGKINMPLDSTIPQETPVFARQMGGRAIDSGSLLWKTLFPSELLRIDGRVPTDKSSQFLLQMRMTSAKELIAVAFSPGSSGSDVGFRILMDFLIAKSRHGLVFPWGSRPKDYHPGKELYIIPLLSSDPIPDYMELLDDLRLPKIRKSNYLVGIWVLNKGKLAPPTAPPAPLAHPSISVPPNPPPLTKSQPFVAPQSATQLPPVVPNIAQLSSLLPTVPPAALAAEVASLTPEQIQLMLQTLTTSQALPNASPPQQPSISPAQYPLPQQTWPHSTPNYQTPYPSPAQQQPHTRNAYPPSSPYDRDSRGGPPYDREWRGDRGRGRGRARGRGGRDYRDESPRKPIDSGWPRDRNRRDSGAGSSSPGQNRWGSSQWS